MNKKLRCTESFYLCGFPSLLRAATASAPTSTQQWVRYQFPTIEAGVHRPQSCRPHGMQKRCYCREVSAGRSCDRPPRREAQLFEDPFGQLSAGLAARLAAIQ